MKNKISSKKIILTILFALLWILSLYFFITKSYKGSVLAVSSIIIHFISFIGIVLQWIDIKKYERTPTNYTKVRNQNLLLALIGIIYFVVLIIINVKYEDKQLKKYGVHCNARVTSTFEKHNKKNNEQKWFANIEYSYNNKIYHQEIETDNAIYIIDDTINILISSKDPELYEVPE